MRVHAVRVGCFRAWLHGALASSCLVAQAVAQDGSTLRGLTPTAAQQPTPVATSAPAPTADDPAAMKAAAVLETHCARCHQQGKLKGLLPSASLGNITRLSEIAREPGLVEPQFPDASRLYLSLVERRMPLDAFHDGVKATEPTADEIQDVRDWIAGLPPRREACAGRSHIPPENVSATIKSVLEADPAAARTTRFLTLTHLHNACVPDTELAAYRQAAAKLMNSLAWSLEPARLDPVDAEQTILRLKLPDLGWVGAHWEKLARAFPYAGTPAQTIAAEIVEAAGTRLPALPADWLAAAAMQPALYADLLGLPAEFDDLKQILRLDTDATVKSGKAVRTAITQSKVTRGHRLIEAHPLVTGGMLWLAYDFASTIGDQDIFQRPLGPQGAPGAATFRHDAVRVMFNLPNGFLAYAVHDSDGRRLDHVPVAVERLDVVGHATSTSGSACIECHSAGPVAVKDELRRKLQADASANSRSLLDALQRVLRSEGELATLFEDEAYRFRRALIRAGVDPDAWIGGLEPVAALKLRYDRDVTSIRAAAEFGLQPPAFRALLTAHTGSGREVAARLLQGAVRRAEIGPLFMALVASPASDSVTTAAGSAKDKDGKREMELVVHSDKSTYKLGDLVTFTARASAECRLTLISVNRAGKAIVLFPNEFEQDNVLAPGREVRVPGARAPYQLRLKEPGVETLIGVCTRAQKLADGIVPDYEKQRFTILGDWRNFIRTALEDEAAERLNPDKGDAKRKKKTRGKAEPAEPVRSGKPDVQSRTAIRYTVE